MLETATIMGQSDPGVTWKHYARLFDRSDVEARVRAAQASLGAPQEKDSGGDFSLRPIRESGVAPESSHLRDLER
jgi:hypothetical protein